jgi:acetyl coenzyme A synthetase (ADP forming)-like protein
MMRRDIRNLRHVFEPDSIAVIGASPKTGKLGHVVLKNIIDASFQGRIYPVNPKYKEVLWHRCYPDVHSIPGKLDLAVFAIPSEPIPGVMEQCGRKGVKGAIVLSAGFGEIGRKDLDEKLSKAVKKYGIAMVGPNCLGALDPSKRLDTLFFPFYKLGRPRIGDISFATQSGAVGSCIVDMAAQFGIGFAKFVSYGNALTLDDADFVEYFASDPNTKQILLYLEGTRDGRKLFEALKKAGKKKPVIVLKAGKVGAASQAAMSHTGNIAGNYAAYQAAFRQAKVIEVDTLAGLFHTVNAFSQPLPKGGRVAVLTDGGGLGVLTADAIEAEGLRLAELSPATVEAVKEALPPYGTVGNPIDLIADSGPGEYKMALDALLADPNVDSIITIVLFQAPALDSSILDIVVSASDQRKKPIFTVAVGGDYTEESRKVWDRYGIPSYDSPEFAVKALKRLTDYSLNLRGSSPKTRKPSRPNRKKSSKRRRGSSLPKKKK